MTELTPRAIKAKKFAADQARRDAKLEADRYKAQLVENYYPLFKDLNRLYPTKNYALED